MKPTNRNRRQYVKSFLLAGTLGSLGALLGNERSMGKGADAGTRTEVRSNWLVRGIYRQLVVVSPYAVDVSDHL